jgi:hypothetical protein
MLEKKYFAPIFLIYLFGVLLFLDKRHHAIGSLIGISFYCWMETLLPPCLRPDMNIHHIATIILSLSAYHYQLPWEHCRVFLNTEVSTIFLTIKNLGIHKVGWVPELFNFVLFLGTFLYFRIWCMGWFLATLPPNSYPLFIMAPAYTIYGLNLFWLLKIKNKALERLQDPQFLRQVDKDD